MRRRILSTMALLVVALAAPFAFGQSADKTVTVTATEFEFSPDTIEVQAGETLELKLVNEGSVAHSYKIKKLSIDSEKILPGESTTVTFTPEEPGDIQFVCDVPGHKTVGMKGTLKVKE